MGDLVTQELDGIAKGVVKKFDAANGYAKKTVMLYIEIGNELVRARTMIKGDNEFGKWRAKNIPNMSKNWAGKLMNVAKRFGQMEELPPSIPMSVLAEVATASDEVVEKVIDAGKDGGSMSVKEARATKKGEDISSSHGEATDEPREVTGHEGMPPERAAPVDTETRRKPNKNVASPAQRAQEVLSLPFMQRLKQYEPNTDGVNGDPFILFGIGSVFTDNAPNSETIDVLYEVYHGMITSEMGTAAASYHKTLNSAKGMVAQLSDDILGDQNG